MLIKSKKASDVRSSEITSPSVYLDRRRFLQSAAMVGAGVAFGTIAGPALAATEKTRVKLAGVNKTKWTQESLGEKLTDYGSVTRYNNFYEFGTGKTDPADNSNKFMPRPWNLAVDGAVEKPGVYDLEDFLKPHQLEERVYRFRCVEAWSMVIPWVGIPLADVIKRMNPAGNAKYVAFETLKDAKRMPGQRRAVLDWPYREGLRMDEAMNPLSFLVVGLYGEVLPNQNGAPLRLMVPWKYGFKSIKSITRFTFTNKRPVGYWEEIQGREYGFWANVNPKVDHPRWSQASERVLGTNERVPTLLYNGYGEYIADLYKDLKGEKLFM